MGKHTILGFSTVASKWREAYEQCKIGDPFDKVISLAGEPDETLDLGDTIVYTYVSDEWKGFARGGMIYRKMTFVVKSGKIFSKTSENLDRIAG